MNLSIHQLAMFREAADRLVREDYQPYLELRRMLARPADLDRAAFRKLFTRYYVLNVGGLSREWKDRFFEWLFRALQHGSDPYTHILKDLYQYPRLKGDQVLAFSFVSKLVAIHDESRPIFDAHVGNFFGLGAPKIGSIDHRIAGFITNLDRIKNAYETWPRDPRFQKLLEILKKRTNDSELMQCHPNRLCDFLVWTVGRLKIGEDHAEG
ncbi:hypothetical protein LLG95_11545 [bacterium]|nr:hypothetical protein [bacterium]